MVTAHITAKLKIEAEDEVGYAELLIEINDRLREYAELEMITIEREPETPIYVG